MEKKNAESAAYGAPVKLDPTEHACPVVASLPRRTKLTGHHARRTVRAEAINWDGELPGFGLRTRASGYKTWIVKLRERGRQRFVTLGNTDVLDASAARAQARRLLERAALDGLPVKSRPLTGRPVPTFASYLPEFWRDYAIHWKPLTLKTNQFYARRELVPAFGHLALDAITLGDIVRWRGDLAERTGSFNRALPVLAAALGYAERLGYRQSGTNPCKGIARYKRPLPDRYLTDAEYCRLARTLAAAEPDNPFGAAAIRLLMFTGARHGEVVPLRWEQVRADRLALPDSKTGPKTVWLNAPAREVLAALPRRSVEGWVFPNQRGDRPLRLDKLWSAVRRAAALPDVRLHDLRHSFASVGIADQLPLHIVGGLLGHALPETTARYAHLADEVIAEAAGRVCDGLALAMGLEP